MATLVKVYGPPLSTAVSRVLACLLEKEVDYQLISVNMAKGEHKKPDYLKIQIVCPPSCGVLACSSILCGHSLTVTAQIEEYERAPQLGGQTICLRSFKPFGQVPAFEDEHISLFESRAISRYICDKYADEGNKGLYGINPLAKASIDQWLEAEGQSFSPPSSTLVFQLAFAPRMKLKQEEGVIRQNEEKLAKVLHVYEKRLGESRFLAGDEFSLADLSHLPNTRYLMNATDRGELITSRENVGRWWSEISSRESWQKVIEKQKPT